MIIKRNKSDRLKPRSTSGKTTGGQQPLSVDEEDAWLLDEGVEEAAEENWSSSKPSRRLDERRRQYRRVEDKNLISRADEEAIAIRENAEREGYEEGLRQAESALNELRGILNTLINVREEAMEKLIDEIAPLAVEVAERIIKTEVKCDETLVLGLVRDTIQKVGRNTKSILVKVHPEDEALVKQNLREHPIPNLHAEIIVMDDENVDQGSCIVETSNGMIDASFSTSLEILKRLFGGGTSSH